MGDSNNLPKAISHKKLSSLLLNAKKDVFSFLEEEDISEFEKYEFIELLKNWEENTTDIIKKISSKDESLLKNKTKNEIMALGAMEVHLNMALQALKVFMDNSK